MSTWVPWGLVDYLLERYDLKPDMVELGLEEHDDSVPYVPSTTISRMGIVMYHD